MCYTQFVGKMEAFFLLQFVQLFNVAPQFFFSSWLMGRACEMGPENLQQAPM